MLDGVALFRSSLTAVVMAVGALSLFVLFLDEGMVKALSVSATTLAVFHWFNAWNCRHESRSIFTMNPFSNKYLIVALTLVVSLHVLALTLPFSQQVFHFTSLSLSEWGIIIAVGSSVVVVEEIRKFFMRLSMARS